MPLDWQGPTDQPFVAPDSEIAQRAIFTSFAMIAERQPEAPALRSPTRRLTYAATHAAALALAGHIVTVSPNGGDVGVILSDDIDVIIATLACLAAGRICLMINAANTPDRISGIIDKARPAVLIAETAAIPMDLQGRFPVVPPALAFQASREPESSFAPADVDDPAIVIFTSGSTGEPKSVARSQRHLITRADLRIRQLHLSASDRILALYPLSGGLGSTAIATALLQGAELCVADMKRAGMRAVMRMMATQRVTILFVIPSLLRAMLFDPAIARWLGGVRGILVNSEPLLRADVAKWRALLGHDCPVVTSYGLTEGGPFAAWFIPATLPSGDGPLALGYLSDWYEYAITDENGQAVPPGEVGELWARGSLIALDPGKGGLPVPDRFIVDPLDPMRQILRTGDVVRLDEDRLLYFVGRTDAMLKIRGSKVNPALIEDALRRAPGIEDATVIIEPAVGQEQVSLIAYVAMVPGVPEDRGQLLTHLRADLPVEMVPARIEFLPVLPRLPNGKIDMCALSEKKIAPMG